MSTIPRDPRTPAEPQPAAARPAACPQRVTLFRTCLADFAAQGPLVAAIQVLEAMGVEVSVPRDQTCCGQPALNSGFPTEAGRVLEQTLDSLDGAEAVVTLAGSCAAMIAHHGVPLLGPATADRAGVRNLWEFTQFVAAFGEHLDLELNATLTYHDGCHMTRLLGERTTPRQILSRIRGVRLVEMCDSETCCGFGGTFSAKFPELSVAMADAKLDNIDAAHVQYVVSADPGCLMQLQTRADATGRAVQTRHIAEIVRDALRRPT